MVMAENDLLPAYYQTRWQVELPQINISNENLLSNQLISEK